MASGEQIAFQPALAHVLAEDFHYRPSLERFRSVGSIVHGDFMVTSKARQPIRSSLIRPNTRKFFDSALRFITSREKLPAREWASAMLVPGLDISRHIRGSPDDKVLRRCRRSHGVRAHPAVSLWR